MAGAYPFQICDADRARLEKWRDCYRSMMFDDVIPFWMRIAPDGEHGGFLSYADRKGRLFSSTKSVWIQGRATWLFAHLYNTERRYPVWLELAKSGAEFMDHKCFAEDGTMYLAVTREGKPMSKGLGFFSEAFAVMGYAELATATDDVKMYKKATELFSMVVEIYRQPMVPVPYVEFPAFHQMKGQAGPMIMLSTAQVLRESARHFQMAGEIDSLDSMCARYVNEIAGFYREDLGCLLEGLTPNDEFIDEPDGRITCPGHSCESAWFILDEAWEKGEAGWNELAVKIVDGAMRFGWDKEFGGILTFVDCKGLPTDSLEHDLKIWWPHNEALVGTLAAWRATGDSKWLDWHETIFDWTMSRFPDAENGEWYGYLRRDGGISNDVKGNMWKGLFHVPRALLKAARLIEDTLK